MTQQVDDNRLGEWWSRKKARIEPKNREKAPSCTAKLAARLSGLLLRRVTPGHFHFFPQLLPVNSDGSKLRMDATLLRAAVDAVEMTPVDWLEPVLLAPAEPEPLPVLLAVRAPAPFVVDFPPAAELDPPDW